MLLGKQIKVEIFRKRHMKTLFFTSQPQENPELLLNTLFTPGAPAALRFPCKPQLHHTARLQSQYLSLLLSFQGSHVNPRLFSLSTVSLSLSAVCSGVLVSVALEDACMFEVSSLRPTRVNSMPSVYSVLCQTILKIPSKFAENLSR